MFKKITMVSLAALLLSAITPQPADAAPHATGTNIVSNGTVYVITQNGERRPYTSAGAFLSYGFNSWTDVVPATAEDLALSVGQFVAPQNGRIICADRGERKGTCYLISEGWRTGFVSESQFRAQGFDFSRALHGDVSFLGEHQNVGSDNEAHRSGTLVRDSNGTVYFVHAGGLAGFTSLAVFSSWGLSFSDVVPMNTADQAKPKSGTVPNRQPGQLNPIVKPDTISPLMITSPNGGEMWPTASQQTIRWNNTSFDSTVEISLTEWQPECTSKFCPLRPIRLYVIASKALNTGDYSWDIGSIPEGNYKVILGGTTQTSVYDESDNYFTITAK